MGVADAKAVVAAQTKIEKNVIINMLILEKGIVGESRMKGE